MQRTFIYKLEIVVQVSWHDEIGNLQATSMSETVYIETSILGYLTARPTTNPVLIGKIEVTREWWRT